MSLQKNIEFSIDFHGVDVRNAIQFLHSLFEFNKRNKLENKRMLLHLIIGKGLHSKNGQNRLKPAFQTYLSRYNYSINCQNEGEIIVSL